MQPSSHHRSDSLGDGVELRLFTALALPEEAARDIARTAVDLAALGVELRATSDADLHVTFAFLGAVSEEHVPAVATALDVAASAVPGPVACRTGDVAAFGAGRVLGLDVDIELHAMLDMARDRFIDAVEPFAPMVDRRAWHPHLSLVRARRHGSPPDLDAGRRAHAMARNWVATELRLYASLPGPVGSTYRSLHVAPLGATVRS